MDEANLLEQLVALLAANDIQYCVIGGQAVNAYAEPLVSLDLDIVVAAEQLALVEQLLAVDFQMKRFPHSLNVGLPGSDLRVQIQTDPRYRAFPEKATFKTVLGLELPVAAVADVLQGKIWVALDPDRRASKRQKDLADIARLVETHPELQNLIPEAIQQRLL